MKIPNIKKHLPLLYLLVFCVLTGICLGYPVNMSHYSLLTFFLLILLSASHTITYRITLVLLALLAAFYAPLGLLYGSVNFNTIASALYTDPQETKEFFTLFGIKDFIPSIIILTLCILLFKQKFTIKYKIPIAIVLCLITFIPLYKPISVGETHPENKVTLLPLRFLIVTVNSYRDVMEQEKIFQQIGKIPLSDGSQIKFHPNHFQENSLRNRIE